MIETLDLKHTYSYIEGLEVSETDGGYSLSSCINYENRFDKPFQMDAVEFDVVPDTERNVAYGLHIYLVKETQKMEYRLFRRIADEDGYNYDYIESTKNLRLMKNILSVSVSPNGERIAKFFNHTKKEVESNET
ncbi:hypothetical protein SFC78_15100 [Bacillus subtilis]|uniref:hypothetical protein n=1 Tax=Bacillus subtilis TaxID=1423 RepID=UPI000FFE1D11|nr:hypothetical protein [Bacillus subtilis]MDQ4709423.1 hypothetical protein [Bacillus subtilis]QAT57089.1 hypothetical protein EQW70_06805 [Bacillus subtilis]QHM06517.1 hypothetical protein C7M27_02455 [Bacillus subtilis]CAF1806673.1 hypothetical protein NRS6131_01390 [Bacillus subtilis]CAI6312945.1 hypothetical protein NRS6131_16875 [Bacillus subtilis]